MSEEENIRLVREIGEVKAELSGLKAEVAGTNQRLDDIVITQLKDHGKRLAMQDIRISSLEQAENRRAGGISALAALATVAGSVGALLMKVFGSISGVPHPAPPHPLLEGPCKRLRPRRSSGTLPSGGGGTFPARGASLQSTWTAMEWIPPFPSAGRSHSPIR